MLETTLCLSHDTQARREQEQVLHSHRKSRLYIVERLNEHSLEDCLGRVCIGGATSGSDFGPGVHSGRVARILYSDSRCILEAEKYRIIISARKYYNTVRKMILNNAISETINRLLGTFEEEEFIY
jgi:hypothetical protein